MTWKLKIANVIIEREIRTKGLFPLGKENQTHEAHAAAASG
jgi:hypothetical protein